MSFPVMFKKGDLLVVLAAAGVAWAWSTGAGSRDGCPEGVRIVSEEGTDTLSLFRDTVLYRGPVTIQVRNGQAAITDSDCHGRQCVETGWLKEPGEMSACMPNGVFIEILGNGEETDAVSY